MIVTYTPENGNKEQWDFDPRRVRASEAILMQRRFGDKPRPWDELRLGILQGDMECRRVLLWHLIRRTHHTLRFEDTPDFYTGELVVEANRVELEEMREQVEKSSAVPEDQKALMLAALDDEIARAPVMDSGKAPSTTGSDATASP